MPIKYVIEPIEPVLNESDFIRELLKWADQKVHPFQIIRAGMEPVVEISGEKYICKLEPPKRIMGLGALNTSSSHMTLGYKFIYLYPLS